MGVKDKLEVTAIAATNSCHYVATVFECLNQGRVFATAPSTLLVEQWGDQFNIDSVIEPEKNYGWYSGERYKTSDSNQIAQIAFSSGTEGKPKAIQISHAALANTVSRLLAVMEITHEIREYVGIPVYHSFGFGRCRTISAVGGEFYIPENGFNPIEILHLLKSDSINAISAVPSLWRIIIADAGMFNEEGRKIRWIEIGSQYMSSDEKLSLKKIFPNAKIIQHYGLTEASRSTFLKVNECSEEHLESVGKAYHGVECRVDSESVIQIKGPHISSSILQEQQVLPLVDSEGWFTTSDLGHIKDGYLYFDGRKDDVINCGGVKIVPEAIESRIKTELHISDGLAIFGRPDKLRGEVPVLAIEESLKSMEKEIRNQYFQCLTDLKVNLNSGDDIFLVDKLPKTDTGKIKRRLISTNYLENNTFSEELVHESDDEPDLKQSFARILGITDLDESESFISLGGDSLNFIQAAVVVEKYHGRLIQGWETIPIRDLLEIDAVSASEGKRDVLVISRSIAVWFMMISHVFNELSLWKSLPGGVMALTKAATPCFLIVFGVGLERSWSGKILYGDYIGTLKIILPKLLMLYISIVLVQSCFLAKSPDWDYYFSVITLNEYGRFVQILMLYMFFMIAIPWLIPIFDRLKFIPLMVVFLTPFVLHHYISFNDTGSFMLDMFIGAKSFKDPSVLLTLPLILFGFVLGKWSSNRLLKKWIISVSAMASVYIIWSFVVFLDSNDFSLSGFILSLRKLEVAYYAYGIISFLFIYLVSLWLAKRSLNSFFWNAAFSAGYAPLQLYVIGNMFLNLGPGRYVNTFPVALKLLLAISFILALAYLGTKITKWLYPSRKPIKRGSSISRLLSIARKVPDVLRGRRVLRRASLLPQGEEQDEEVSS